MHCHWPDRFIGERLVQRSRFSYDVSNTERQLRIMLKVGGGENGGPRVDIHWHQTPGTTIWKFVPGRG